MGRWFDTATFNYNKTKLNLVDRRASIPRHCHKSSDLDVARWESTTWSILRSPVRIRAHPDLSLWTKLNLTQLLVSLDGQDTRFSPWRPGFDSRTRKLFFFSLSLPQWLPVLLVLGEEKKIFFVSFMSACLPRDKEKKYFFLPLLCP